MAPTITCTAEWPQQHKHLSHKMRKPLVEKMRRYRINNSIEELKALLGPQMLNQHPDSKMEKGNILESSVCLPRGQIQSDYTPCPLDAVKCCEELAHLLFEESGGAHIQRRLHTYIKTLHLPSDEVNNETTWHNSMSSVQQFTRQDRESASGASWRPR